MKIQKASIQLLNTESFAVLAFRKNINGIVVEFYSNKEIMSDRIIKRTKINSNKIINRMIIQNAKEINGEILKWLVRSHEVILMNRNI